MQGAPRRKRYFVFLADGDGTMLIFCVLALLMAASLLGACARKVRVEINSLAEHGASQQGARLKGQRCIVLPASQDMRADDLQFQEFSVQVSASLAKQGCAVAHDIENADVAVLLSYGISEPFIVEQRSYAVYHPWGRWSRAMPDFVPVTTAYIFKTCELGLEARIVEKTPAVAGDIQKDVAPTGQKVKTEAHLGKQIWKINASHTGQHVDLRMLFPWLLAAAKEYYGVDSGQNVLVSVSEEDLACATLPTNNCPSRPEANGQ